MPPADRPVGQNPIAPPVTTKGGDGGPSGGTPPGPRRWFRSPGVWVSSTYFAEGFPYTVVNTLAEVLFKEHGASLQTIGLTSLFHLPWNIKFLWGPFLDAFATKRAWLIGCEALIGLLLVGLALVSGLEGALGPASAFFVLLAFASATHDIAIDGFYLEGLDKEGQSRYVGLRAPAYRLAMLVVSSVPLILLERLGFMAMFLSAAAMMGVLLLVHMRILPRCESPGRPVKELARDALRGRFLLLGATLALVILAARAVWQSEPAQGVISSLLAQLPWLNKIGVAEWVALALLTVLLGLIANLSRLRRWIATKDSFYAQAFVDFLEQRHVGRILAFVILYRAGESFILKMRYAFLRDIGMTPEQFGYAAGTVGLVAAMVATILGGWLISRHGLRRWIWPFILAQNVPNLLYMWLSMHHTQLASRGGQVGMGAFTTIIGLESFGAGLGTAVFMVYLMRCCRPRFKAAHMAILTALMSLSFTLAGVASGFLAEALGFTAYFGFTFVATLPGMALVWVIPYLDGTTAADGGMDATG